MANGTTIIDPIGPPGVAGSTFRLNGILYRYNGDNVNAPNGQLCFGAVVVQEKGQENSGQPETSGTSGSVELEKTAKRLKTPRVVKKAISEKRGDILAGPNGQQCSAAILNQETIPESSGEPENGGTSRNAEPSKKSKLRIVKKPVPEQTDDADCEKTATTIMNIQSCWMSSIRDRTVALVDQNNRRPV